MEIEGSTLESTKEGALMSKSNKGSKRKKREAKEVVMIYKLCE